MDGEKISKWVPAGTAYVIAASISYTSGYFGVIGTSWMQFLSIQDTFSLAFSSLPPIIASMGLVIAVDFVVTSRIFTNDEIFILEKHIKIRSFLICVFSILLFSGPLYIMFSSSADDNISVNIYASVIGLMSASGLRFVLLLFPKKDDIFKAVASFGMIFLFFAITVGASNSTRLLQRNPDQMVFLSNSRSICTHIMFIGAKGVIISDGPGRPRVLVRDADIRSIATHMKCRGPDKNSSGAKGASNSALNAPIPETRFGVFRM